MRFRNAVAPTARSVRLNDFGSAPVSARDAAAATASARASVSRRASVAVARHGADTDPHFGAQSVPRFPAAPAARRPLAPPHDEPPGDAGRLVLVALLVHAPHQVGRQRGEREARRRPAPRTRGSCPGT